jgi:multimeric flavodoxin WrbA
MQDVNVLVVFQSRLGSTEQLALAAAVGAVEGRANIRLRRLSDAALLPAADGGTPEYIAPRDSDALWADAILAGTPAGPCSLSIGFERYFDSLEALRDQGKLQAKIGASFTHGFAADALLAAMHRAGLTTVGETCDPDARTAARLQGRRVAEAARVLKTPGSL